MFGCVHIQTCENVYIFTSYMYTSSREIISHLHRISHRISRDFTQDFTKRCVYHIGSHLVVNSYVKSHIGLHMGLHEKMCVSHRMPHIGFHGIRIAREDVCITWDASHRISRDILSWNPMWYIGTRISSYVIHTSSREILCEILSITSSCEILCDTHIFMWNPMYILSWNPMWYIGTRCTYTSNRCIHRIHIHLYIYRCICMYM